MRFANGGKKMKRIWPQEFIKGIGQIVEKIPTDEERRNIIKSIDELIRFLQDLEKKLEAMPTDSKRQEIKRAAQAIYSFLEEARADPLKASILGLSIFAKTKGRKAPVILNEEELQKAVREIESTPVPELTTKLMAYNKPQLIYLGKKFHTHVTEKMSKVDIVNKIAKSLENVRGYELLRTLPSEKSER
jgi:hypothetical protein